MADDGIFVTGVGAVTAAGEHPGDLAEVLASGEFCVREITFSSSGPGAPPAADSPAPPALGFPCDEFELSRHVETVTSYMDRLSALSLAAAKLTLSEARRLTVEDRADVPGEVGLSYGTAWGCLDSMALVLSRARARPRAAPPLPFSHAAVNSPASILAIEFGLRGRSAVVSAGGVSSAQAVGLAADAIAREEAGALLAGGGEALSPWLLAHYRALGELKGARDEAGAGSGLGLPGPDHGRLPGEGAAFVMLEAGECAWSGRPFPPLARLAGWALDSGGDPAEALAAALDEAETGNRAVAAVLLASGFLAREREAEEQALGRVFGDSRPLTLRPALALGETAGAHGAFSIALATLLVGGRLAPEAAAKLAAGEVKDSAAGAAGALAGRLQRGRPLLVNAFDLDGGAVSLALVAAKTS